LAAFIVSNSAFDMLDAAVGRSHLLDGVEHLARGASFELARRQRLNDVGKDGAHSVGIV
jgi:hypothetical protein